MKSQAEFQLVDEADVDRDANISIEELKNLLEADTGLDSVRDKGFSSPAEQMQDQFAEIQSRRAGFTSPRSRSTPPVTRENVSPAHAHLPEHLQGGAGRRSFLAKVKEMVDADFADRRKELGNKLVRVSSFERERAEQAVEQRAAMLALEEDIRSEEDRWAKQMSAFRSAHAAMVERTDDAEPSADPDSASAASVVRSGNVVQPRDADVAGHSQAGVQAEHDCGFHWDEADVHTVGSQLPNGEPLISPLMPPKGELLARILELASAQAPTTETPASAPSIGEVACDMPSERLQTRHPQPDSALAERLEALRVKVGGLPPSCSRYLLRAKLKLHSCGPQPGVCGRP